MKTVAFVPGFDTCETDVEPLLGMFRTLGYATQCVDMDWSATIETWREHFLAAVSYLKPEQTVLAGFSIGAVTAMAAAVEWTPSALWLMSLSSRFQEDLCEVPPSHLKMFDAAQLEAFGRLEFSILVDKIQCPTGLVIGRKEYDQLPRLAFRTHAVRHALGSPQSHIYVAEGAGHELLHPHYLEAVRRLATPRSA